MDILFDLYHEVIIPKAVYQEVVTEGAGRPGSRIIKNLCDNNQIQIKEVKNLNLVIALKKDLDKGESEVIALALEIGHDLILLEESDAREMASFYQIKYTGFIGVLLKAYHSGIIDDFKHEIDKAINAGFYLNVKLYNRLIREYDK